MEKKGNGSSYFPIGAVPSSPPLLSIFFSILQAKCRAPLKVRRINIDLCNSSCKEVILGVVFLVLR